MWSPSTRWSPHGIFHALTEYDRWMEAEETYAVPYVLGYQPFFLANRSAWIGSQGAGMYDDDCMQGGWGRASLVLEAAMLGYVLTDLPRISSFLEMAPWPAIFRSMLRGYS